MTSSNFLWPQGPATHTQIYLWKRKFDYSGIHVRYICWCPLQQWVSRYLFKFELSAFPSIWVPFSIAESDKIRKIRSVNASLKSTNSILSVLCSMEVHSYFLKMTIPYIEQLSFPWFEYFSLIILCYWYFYFITFNLYQWNWWVFVNIVNISNIINSF